MFLYHGYMSWVPVSSELLLSEYSKGFLISDSELWLNNILRKRDLTQFLMCTIICSTNVSKLCEQYTLFLENTFNMLRATCHSLRVCK